MLAPNFTPGQRNLIWVEYNEPSLMHCAFSGSQGNHEPLGSASLGLCHRHKGS